MHQSRSSECEPLDFFLDVLSNIKTEGSLTSGSLIEVLCELPCSDLALQIRRDKALADLHRNISNFDISLDCYFATSEQARKAILGCHRKPKVAPQAHSVVSSSASAPQNLPPPPIGREVAWESIFLVPEKSPFSGSVVDATSFRQELTNIFSQMRVSLNAYSERHCSQEKRITRFLNSIDDNRRIFAINIQKKNFIDIYNDIKYISMSKGIPEECIPISLRAYCNLGYFYQVVKEIVKNDLSPESVEGLFLFILDQRMKPVVDGYLEMKKLVEDYRDEHSEIQGLIPFSMNLDDRFHPICDQMVSREISKANKAFSEMLRIVPDDCTPENLRSFDAETIDFLVIRDLELIIKEAMAHVLMQTKFCRQTTYQTTTGKRFRRIGGK